VCAVNKADLPGADSTAQHLRGMLALAGVTSGASRGGHGGHQGAPSGTAEASPNGSWEVPVQSCVAQRDEGIAELLEALQRHFAWLRTEPAGQARRAERARGQLLALLRSRLSEVLLERQHAEIEQLAERVSRGELDPYAAVQALLSSAGLL